jgi:hypothetical protein
VCPVCVCVCPGGQPAYSPPPPPAPHTPAPPPNHTHAALETAYRELESSEAWVPPAVADIRANFIPWVLGAAVGGFQRCKVAEAALDGGSRVRRAACLGVRACAWESGWVGSWVREWVGGEVGGWNLRRTRLAKSFPIRLCGMRT